MLIIHLSNVNHIPNYVYIPIIKRVQPSSILHLHFPYIQQHEVHKKTNQLT